MPTVAIAHLFLLKRGLKTTIEYSHAVINKNKKQLYVHKLDLLT